MKFHLLVAKLPQKIHKIPAECDLLFIVNQDFRKNPIAFGGKL
jgi:hypothetical protein